MDEMSDGERNSEDGEDEDEVMVGNDVGDEDGMGGGYDVGAAVVVGRDEGVVVPEEVVRRGVVLVGQDKFEGVFDIDKLSG